MAPSTVIKTYHQARGELLELLNSYDRKVRNTQTLVSVGLLSQQEANRRLAGAEDMAAQAMNSLR